MAGSRVRLDALTTSHVLANWKGTVASFFSLLSPGDWVALDWSALTLTSRMLIQAMFRPLNWLPGLSPKADPA
jgi:hypothetical protein